MSSDRRRGNRWTDAFRWYSHPLTSVIVLVILSLAIAAVFGRDVGPLAFFAMLEFLRECAKATQEHGDDGSSSPELDQG
ncbi:MAG: hypothetical protein WBD41_27955 [Rhodococcus sp. (in: high G+C Gram-positive bacteria)]